MAIESLPSPLSEIAGLIAADIDTLNAENYRVKYQDLVDQANSIARLTETDPAISDRLRKLMRAAFDFVDAVTETDASEAQHAKINAQASLGDLVEALHQCRPSGKARELGFDW